MILSRDREGKVHVFLNSCRHRGMKVCPLREGNAAVLTCPYHGWSYSTDGKLVGVPYFREAYHGALSKWRNSVSTRVRSGPSGILRRRPFSNISAISCPILTPGTLSAYPEVESPR